MRRLSILVVAAALAVTACGDTVASTPTTGPSAVRPPGTDVPSSTTTTTEAPITTPPGGSPGDGDTTEPTRPRFDPTDLTAAPVQPVPTSPPGSAPVTGGSADRIAAPAIADLGQRLGVAGSAIEVVSVESVVWPDRSLGCPRPGMSYVQVQVDGARILLRHDGTTYAYHSGGGRGPFLCEGKR